MTPDRRKAICRECTERPEGCWKAVEYGCQTKYRRAEQHAAETGDCPLGKLELYPAAGSIFLPAVRTIVYTTRSREAQHVRTAKMLDRLGFTDWHFHYGEKFSGRGDFRVFVAADYARILTAESAPLLFLEDDIELRQWNRYARPPDGAQIAMLGGGRYAHQATIGRARELFPDIRRAHRYGYLDLDETWMRVFGMLCSHAYLFLVDEVLQEAGRAIAARAFPADLSLAMEQWRWNVCCLKTPIFYQIGREQTRNYAPWPPEPPEARTIRRSRLRSRRREALTRIPQLARR